MAQLVAHHTGSVGVRGSSPLSSTRKPQVRALKGQREKLTALGGDVEIDLFDLERCTHILDLPHMESTRNATWTFRLASRRR